MKSQPSSSEQYASLEYLLARCEGAYSDNTLRGYCSDLKQFQAWCEARALEWLPAEPQAIADFIDEQTKSMAIATIKRRVEAIRFAHRMSDLPSPAENSEVRLAGQRKRSG